MPSTVIEKLFENELIVMSSERIIYLKIYGILNCKEIFKPSKRIRFKVESPGNCTVPIIH